jgi:hypothetical protein
MRRRVTVPKHLNQNAIESADGRHSIPDSLPI